MNRKVLAIVIAALLVGSTLFILDLYGKGKVSKGEKINVPGTISMIILGGYNSLNKSYPPGWYELLPESKKYPTDPLSAAQSILIECSPNCGNATRIVKTAKNLLFDKEAVLRGVRGHKYVSTLACSSGIAGVAAGTERDICFSFSSELIARMSASCKDGSCTLMLEAAPDYVPDPKAELEHLRKVNLFIVQNFVINPVLNEYATMAYLGLDNYSRYVENTNEIGLGLLKYGIDLVNYGAESDRAVLWLSFGLSAMDAYNESASREDALGELENPAFKSDGSAGASPALRQTTDAIKSFCISQKSRFDRFMQEGDYVSARLVAASCGTFFK